MEMRRISRGETQGKDMEILIGAEVEMQRIPSLHAQEPSSVIAVYAMI
jgi:hypothetical protein